MPIRGNLRYSNLWDGDACANAGRRHWRICSGVSHAKTWALNTVTTEVDSKAFYEHATMSARVPNRGLFLTDLRVARRVMQHACGLHRIRTTARPHRMTLKLVQRDGAGNEVGEGD